MVLGFSQVPLFGSAAAENAVIHSAIFGAGSKAPETAGPNRPRNRIDGRLFLTNDGPRWGLNGQERQLLSESRAWLVRQQHVRRLTMAVSRTGWL